MTKFRIWAAVITAIVLGLIGIVLAEILPLPSPTTLTQTKILYGSLGVLISFLTFGRIASWTVKTFSRLGKQLTLRLASEIINQFTRAASRGWTILPGYGQTHGSAPTGMDNTIVGVDPRVNPIMGKPIILDTSSIIDGRVLDIAKTGFLSGLILIPDFVLTELQQVADSSDPMKRLRGRKGFETVSALKKIKGLKVEIWEKEIVGKNVDEKLMRLAKIMAGKILTCDYNLSRVAQISGTQILNFNDLANALKTIYIPGEKLELKITSQGKEKDQGVGYLIDGTMVVVESGAKLVGQEVLIEVTKVLQVPAGRMVFGKIL